MRLKISKADVVSLSPINSPMRKIDFVTTVLKGNHQIGAVFPSSRFLVKKMLRPVDFENSNTILELGPGNGPVTKEILRQMKSDAELFIFETNREFYEFISGIADARKIVFHESAEKISITLKHHGFFRQADTVISSIPLALLPSAVSKKIVQEVFDILKPGGIFVQFQYSLKSRRMLRGIFKEVKLDFTPVNIPPAFVYICRK